LYPPDEEEPEIKAEETTTDGNGPRAHHPNDLEPPFATSNTITLIHANAQPNLSLLKHFNFTPETADPSHPLTSHLKTLSWLQLLSPSEDTAYSTPPPTATPEQLSSWKSGKRGTYYRKRRRWARTNAIVNETRAGNFDGLLIASSMDSVGILKSCVPLIRGGAPVVIYSPFIESLTKVADLYSTSRRTAFISSPPAEGDLSKWPGNDDFPLNPTLLLGVSVQTSKVRRWQALPGRTHPLMTSRGGAEGYVLTAVRVLPAGGKVEARGKYKRRKVTKDVIEENAVVVEGKEDDSMTDVLTDDVAVAVTESLA